MADEDVTDCNNIKILASEYPQKSIIIECENGGRVVISLVTGEVTLIGVDVSETGRHFWNAVKHAFPGM